MIHQVGCWDRLDSAQEVLKKLVGVVEGDKGWWGVVGGVHAVI